MATGNTLSLRFVFAFLIVGILAPSLIAETLYVDSQNGNDNNPGSKGKPLLTISKAAAIVNDSNAAGPTTIKVSPGVYNLTRAVVFKNTRPYTEQKRLTIQATILPDDPNWLPSLMPVVLSTENSRTSEMTPGVTGTYSMKIKISHVTICGLKFLGNPSPNNWHCPVERIGGKLDDLVLTQCMFIGNKDTLDIYCASLATGDRFVVDHCIFYNCHACVVFWDGLEGIGGKGCAMRYSIVDGAYQSGVWTCRTEEDLEFHHNIVINSEYFWMREKTENTKKYVVHDSIITNNKYYSGYGIESGPTGQTGAEVTFKEKNVPKDGEVLLEKNKTARNYMHVKPGTFGSDLDAGLFKK